MSFQYDPSVIDVFVKSFEFAVHSNTAEKPVLHGHNLSEKATTMAEYSSLITLVGQRTSGHILVSMEHSGGLAFATKLYDGTGMEITIDVIKDVIGELCNQTSGQVRKLFLGLNREVAISTPTIIVGKNHTIEFKSPAPSYLLSFMWNSHPMFVSFVCHDSEASEAEAGKSEEILDSGDINFF